jgi:hypothetical protein
MKGRTKKMRTVSFIAALGLLALGGCSADYADASKAQYVLLLTGINLGVPLESDLRISSGAVCPDSVPVRLENHAKNPAVTGTGFRGDMVVERYEVRYYRSDGRNTQGVDVPYTITGNVSTEILAEGSINLDLEVVRRQAKAEPPLASLVGGGGTLIVTMFAEVTIHARMTTGEETNSVTGRLQIDFADFADTDTDCP